MILSLSARLCDVTTLQSFLLHIILYDSKTFDIWGEIMYYRVMINQPMKKEEAASAPAGAAASQSNGFAGLGITPNILAVLDQLKFTVPTPIQHKAIPVAIEGKDVVGIAQTGTGKSLAFGLPLMQRLMQNQQGRGLIILPTRELADQIAITLLKIGRPFGLKIAVLIGGASMYAQVQQLRNGPHIIIGTPGRINDHIKQKTLNLGNIGILVLRMMLRKDYPSITQVIASIRISSTLGYYDYVLPSETASPQKNLKDI